MGWTHLADKLCRVTPAEFVTTEFNRDSPTIQATVIARSTVRNVIYVAIRHEIKAIRRSYVFCAIVLFKNTRREGVRYKAMQEGQVPLACVCPDAIMRLLSPVSDIPGPGETAQWRANVAAAKAARAATRRKIPKLKPGDVISLAHPARLKTLAVEVSRFTVVRFNKRTPILAPVSDPHLECRLRRSALVGAIVEHTAAPASTHLIGDALSSPPPSSRPAASG
jgi:hypothetical protein